MALSRTAGLLAASLFAVLTVGNPVQARDLTVVGFGGSLQAAMKTAYFTPFAQSGTPLIEESYTGGIAKLKAMNQAKSVAWDVVQMDENEMMLACDEGLLEKFDWKAIPAAQEILPQAQAACGVGAFVWSKILAYDASKIDGVSGWADFWNVTRWPGKRALRKQARMTLELALLADGVDPEKLYDVLGTKAGADRAFAKLDQLKPHIVWWESGAQPIEWLASGNVVMTSAYNGRVAAANAEGRNFRTIWNQQLYSMDFWAIPKGTDNLKQARDLVGYMMRADSQKRFAEAIPYGLTNRKAADLLDAKVRDTLPTAAGNMKSALLISNPFWVDHEEELQRRFDRWVAQ